MTKNRLSKFVPALLAFALFTHPLLVFADEGLKEYYDYQTWAKESGATFDGSVRSAETFTIDGLDGVEFSYLTDIFCGHQLNYRWAADGDFNPGNNKGLSFYGKRRYYALCGLQAGDSFVMTFENNSDRPALYLYSGNLKDAEGNSVPQGNLTSGVMYTMGDSNPLVFYNSHSKTPTVWTLSVTSAKSLEIGSEGCATFSSPVPVDISGTGLTAYAATAGAVADEVKLQNVGDIIPGATGVVVYGQPGSYSAPTVAEADGGAEGNLLRPVLFGEEVPSVSGGSQNYILTRHDGQLGFFMIGQGGRSIGAGRAYLQMPAGGAAKAVRMAIGGGETTGISTAVADEGKGDGLLYDLSGRRVSNPSKGIYIRDGKKVVIK